MIINEGPVHINLFYHLANGVIEWFGREILYLSNGNTLAACGIGAIAISIAGIAVVYFVGIPGIIFGVVASLSLTAIAVWLLHDGRRKEQDKVLAAVIHQLHEPIDLLLKPLEIVVEGEKYIEHKIEPEKKQNQENVPEKNKGEENNSEKHEIGLRNTLEKVNHVLKSCNDPRIKEIVASTEEFLKIEKPAKNDQKKVLQEIKSGITNKMSKIHNISQHHIDMAKKFIKKLG